MISSLSEKTETGEPSSYQHTEEMLSKVATGEDTREGQSTEATFLPKAKDEALKAKSNENDSVDQEEGSPSCLRDEKTDSFVNIENQAASGSTPVDRVGRKQTTLQERRLEVVPSTPKTAATLGENGAYGTEVDKATAVQSVNGAYGTEVDKATAVQSENRADSSEHSASSPPKVEGEKALPFDASSTKIDSPGPPKVIHAEISSHIPASCLSSQRNSSPPQVSPNSTKSKPGTTLRRGKWTMEEEAYVARVIQDFNSGFLNAPAGTTLRSYLSEKLQCDPMRITKKFTGDACIGKRVFHPAVRSTGNAAAIDKAQAELDALERRWRRRLEMQQRESAKKAAAAANASSHGEGGHGMIQGVPVALLSGAGSPAASAGSPLGRQNVVTQAASWLDRANALLKGTKAEGGDSKAGSNNTSPAGLLSVDSMPSAEIENQMKEVQRLIYEGPLIQQTTAVLPHLLSSKGQSGTANALHSAPAAPPPDHTSERNANGEHADKRMRRSGSGAEDAEALVGFLRSVRASAAAGQDM